MLVLAQHGFDWFFGPCGLISWVLGPLGYSGGAGLFRWGFRLTNLRRLQLRMLLV